MTYVPLQKLLKDKETSLYKLVIGSSLRANELMQGAQPLVKSDSKKVSIVALNEFSTGKVRYVESKSKSKKASE